jgi:type I restriction enzyme, S subunit
MGSLSELPRDWRWKKLGKYIASCRNGYGRRPVGLEDGPIVLRLADVAKGTIDLTDVRRVTMSDKEFETYKLMEGDVLFTRVNGSREQVGQCIFVDKCYENLAFNDHLIRIRLKESLSGRYLRFLMLSDYARARLMTFIPPTEGGQLTVNQKSLSNLRIPIPSLPEQHKIAEILGTWDDAIALVKRRIKAARQRKKGLMQCLLTGRLRFPEFVQSRDYRQTKLGAILADWRIARVQSVAKVNKETLASNSDSEQKYLYLELSAVDKGIITMPTERKEFVNLPSRARRVLRKGDVIMATVRPNLLGFAICEFEPQDVLCSTGFALLSPKELSDSRFIYQSLYSDTVLRQVHGLVTGSNYPAINTLEVKGLKLFWPRLREEREKIAAVLQTCDREIELLEQKRDALQRQKKGLMQRLLTGRVRVKK